MVLECSNHRVVKWAAWPSGKGQSGLRRRGMPRVATCTPLDKRLSAVAGRSEGRCFPHTHANYRTEAGAGNVAAGKMEAVWSWRLWLEPLA